MKIKLKELRRIIQRELLVAEVASAVGGSTPVPLESLVREMFVFEAGEVLLKPPASPESNPAFRELLAWASSRIPGSVGDYKSALESLDQEGDYTKALELLNTAFMMMGIPAAIEER